MLDKKIRSFKQKYYKALILKGSTRLLATVISLFVLLSFLEYFGRFDSSIRAFFFYGFVTTSFVTLAYWVGLPFFSLFANKLQISDYKAAEIIGKFYSPVNDKLYNTLQLSRMQEESALARAGLMYKQQELDQYDFNRVIEYRIEKKFLWFLLIPLGFLILTLLTNPSIIQESASRIVNYEKSFVPPPPFSFELINKNLTAFKGESLSVSFRIIGNTTPSEVDLLTSDGKVIHLKPKNDELIYEFNQLIRNTTFYLSSSDVKSQDYEIRIYSRPSLSTFDIQATYPAYTKKKSQTISNQGNLTVPEGTDLNWLFRAQNTNSIHLFWDNDTIAGQANEAGNVFEIYKNVRNSSAYEIRLNNEFSQNKEEIKYYIEVIKDQYPEISLIQYEDSTQYDYILLGGNISDDYGLRKLSLKYRVISDSTDQKETFQGINLPISKSSKSQTYYYQFDLSKLSLPRGSTVEYYTQVWDNDGVNGSKSVQSRKISFKLPSKDELKESIKENSKKASSQMSSAQEKTEKLKNKISDIQKKVKTKRKLSWQDKKEIKDLIKEHEDLKKEVEKVNQFNENLNKKQEMFNKADSAIAEKSKQLQKLMDELIDEETQKLYDELNQLIEEKTPDLEEIDEVLEEIEMNEENLENELDRAIEMFKQLQVEQKAKDIAQELKELSEIQKDLAEDTDQSKKKDFEELEQKQEMIKEEFEKLQEELDELDQMNEDLENPRELDQMQEEQEQTEQQLEQSQQQLQNKKRNKAQESQQKAAEQMKQMAQKLQQMMQSSSMQQMQENYDDLRKILENLVKLSFDQERVMKGFTDISSIDPKFLELSQEQLKLKDDAKIVEDSLLALAKRVSQIESFVTREINQMNDYMEKSMRHIRDRMPRYAISKQQFAMTSMNNLALMLSDVLKQMQEQMSSMMSGSQMNQQKGKGSPSLSELQQQLNQQIQQLKKGGQQPGNGMSKKLAQMAAQQERIRRALQKKMQEEGGTKPGGKSGDGDPLELMEETEEDLVNKRITQKLIERQQEILTRLLESENAERERDEKEEREAEAAKDQEREITPEFLDYLKQKEAQVEMLKTVPASLQEYYKEQVNQYFNNIIDKPNGQR